MRRDYLSPGSLRHSALALRFYARQEAAPDLEVVPPAIEEGRRETLLTVALELEALADERQEWWDGPQPSLWARLKAWLVETGVLPGERLPVDFEGGGLVLGSGASTSPPPPPADRDPGVLVRT